MLRGEFLSRDGLGLAQLIRDSDVKPSEVVATAIEIVEDLDGDINALTNRCFDEAINLARSLDDAPKEKPFQGVPFLLKDLGALCKGLRTSFGSRYLSGFVSPIDDRLVESFKSAGFVILGNTNTPEFGLACTTEPKNSGPTRNPWDLSRTSGGSSGGAAAAVSSGMVPIAHANDGGGSIRIPAACCGLVGLKPSRARVSSGNASGQSFGGLACSHVVTRSVRDSAAVLDAIAGQAPGDPFVAPKPSGSFLDCVGREHPKLRIAVCDTTFEGVDIDPEVKGTIIKVATTLEDMGHSVEFAYPQSLMERSINSFTTVWALSALSMVTAIESGLGRPPAPEELEPMTWHLLEVARSKSAIDLIKAWEVLFGLSYEIGEFMRSTDVLLTPTLTAPAVKLGTFDTCSQEPAAMFRSQLDYAAYTSIFNATGQPSISLPLGQNRDGLPIGAMFTGRLGEESSLIALAASLEQAMPWSSRKPKTWGGAIGS